MVDSEMNDNSAHGNVSGVLGRRRSQRACGMCYQKKTKCELDGPESDAAQTCVQCMRRRTDCVFPTVQEKAEDLQSDEYVKFLKDRLGRAEALLKAAGILQESDMVASDEDEDPPYEDWKNDHRHTESSGGSSDLSPASRISLDSYQANFPEVGDLEVSGLFKTHKSDETRYFGRSSSLSILSRGGIEWIKNKTGDISFLSIVSPNSANDSPWNTWRPDVFHDLFASQVFKPLPSRSEVFSLIKDFFRTANRLFPIFHERTFMNMVEWQYTQQTCDDAARWASINMVVCLAYEYRFSHSLKPEKDRERSRLYFQNAMSVFTELALRRTDLLSVQALLSMAFYLRGNSGTQAAVPFITAAMRSSQRMGLHRDISRPDLSAIEVEQRRRVFWIAFTVDQSTCLRTGNAPSQHPDDFDAPLPSEMEDDLTPEFPSNILFFRQLCRMSLIKSRIYSRLYTAKAMLKPPREIYRIVTELHAELQEWNKDYPVVEEPKEKVAGVDFLFGFANIALKFGYYNALIMIHRVPLLINYQISSREFPDEELMSLSKAHASRSALIATKAARDTLKMVNNMPWGDIAWMWAMLYYVFLAAATIFSTIIRDSRHAQVREDLKSLNMASTFFTSLMAGTGPASYAGFMARMTGNLERVARMVVEKEEKRARSPDEKEEEHRPSAKKRQSRVLTASHPKPRHKPMTMKHHVSAQSSSLPESTKHHRSRTLTASISNASAVPHNGLGDIGIPEAIEGLPPINSSGYVVPLSPESGPGEPRTFASRATIQHPPPPPSYTTIGLGVTNLNLNGVHTTEIPQNNSTIPFWQPQDPLETQSSSQHSSSSNTTAENDTSTGTRIPESWQVPLTADWQYGDNLWSGLFPTESIATSANGQDISLPILSAESYLHPTHTAQHPIGINSGNIAHDPTQLMFGTDTTTFNSAAATAQEQTQVQNQEEFLWANGMLGLF
ncbi:hypothetical protein N7495_008335 [Penicillium taxi]|uniref:uncharacterized protein n=1 Tax=Penicillium taxi TaxID=168475 RepID=UPI002544DA02|nr:uncharacterized protein N7495_008335 [Penicillium taxi]KAJ5888294.1 hypothetical protein N7495_008335 [Penicillium taxi]